MLTYIEIRDFVLVQQLALDIDAGMTVLTGETGAGKSILIDALNLALGDRSDTGVIRFGAERADISAHFDISQVIAAQHWLAEHELDAGTDCLLRRTITREGRSRAYINGNSVPLQALRDLGEMLVDIHGQHEHQSLLRPDMQRQLLDDYAEHAALLVETGALFQEWKRAGQELDALQKASTQRDARRELLQFQVRELEILGLSDTELAEINDEHSRLSHAARLLESCHQQLQTLAEDDELTVLALLTRAGHELAQLQAFDRRLGVTSELLASAAIQIREGVSELRHYVDTLELDPARLSWIDQRLASVHELSRKHRVTPEQLPALLMRLSQEWAALEDADSRLNDMQGGIDAAANAYRACAKKLAESRTRTALELGERVSANMQQLNMSGGCFEIALEPLPPEQFSASGSERVEFRVSANPGQPLRPLNKVASGGELSRISLAIQVITARKGRIPTLIFDEVDVGIGGGVAEIVGQQLRALSHDRQILCVTHLPQVAAQGLHHLQVNKETVDTTSLIRVEKLSFSQRRHEIARMLGGINITENTLAHAAEMLESAQNSITASFGFIKTIHSASLDDMDQAIRKRADTSDKA